MLLGLKFWHQEVPVFINDSHMDPAPMVFWSRNWTSDDIYLCRLHLSPLLGDILLGIFLTCAVTSDTRELCHQKKATITLPSAISREKLDSIPHLFAPTSMRLELSLSWTLPTHMQSWPPAYIATFCSNFLCFLPSFQGPCMQKWSTTSWARWWKLRTALWSDIMCSMLCPTLPTLWLAVQLISLCWTRNSSLRSFSWWQDSIISSRASREQPGDWPELLKTSSVLSYVMLFHTSEFRSGVEGDGGYGGMQLGWGWTLEIFVTETLRKLNKQCKPQQCSREFV